MIKLLRRGVSQIFLGLAVVGSKMHVAIHEILTTGEQANMSQWKRGLLWTLQRYERFRNGKNGDQ